MIGIVVISGKVMEGTASIYHDKYHGRKTANGEVFSQNKLTAASNFYKLGSIVEVTNLENGKKVTVKINDRMAKWTEKKDRIIDLSTAAAKKIKFFKSKGLLKVKVEEIENNTNRDTAVYQLDSNINREFS